MTRISKLLFSLAAVALGCSVAANVALWRAAVDRFAENNRVRRDPFELDYYADPVPEKTGRRIVLFGDSRIALWTPLPKIDGTEIVNRGIGGQTSAQLVGRVGRDVLALDPDLVVIQACMNDLKGVGVTPWASEEIERACIDNLETITASITASGAKVVLTTVFPVGPVDMRKRFTVWSEDIVGAVHRANARIRKLSMPGLTVVDCDVPLAEDGRMPAALATETYHLTDEGYEVLNRHLESRL